MSRLIVSLERGKWYTIITRQGSQRYNRLSIMQYIGTDGKYLVLNARPVAGTQTLDPQNIVSMKLVEGTPKPIINKVVRP